jgi:hypothetical protein
MKTNKLISEEMINEEMNSSSYGEELFDTSKYKENEYQKIIMDFNLKKHESTKKRKESF